MVAVTLLEMISIGMVVPVIHVLMVGEESDSIYSSLFALLPFSDSPNKELWITALFAIVFIIKNVLLLSYSHMPYYY